MNLRTLDSVKAGCRLVQARLNGDTIGALGDMGAVVSVERRGVFPVIWFEFDKHRPGLPLDNYIVLSPDCYCDLTAPDEGIDSRIDPDNIVACLEITATPRSSEDEQEQELRRKAALNELEALAGVGKRCRTKRRETNGRRPVPAYRPPRKHPLRERWPF
jgi:hypothetical protein